MLNASSIFSGHLQNSLPSGLSVRLTIARPCDCLIDHWFILCDSSASKTPSTFSKQGLWLVWETIGIGAKQCS